MIIKTKNEKPTVLHVATLNLPIRSDLGYGPIETIIYNIDKGLHLLGHRSIIACSGDSRVAGEHYLTIEKSIGNYWSDDTPERRRDISIHLSKALDRAKMGDIDVIHTHDIKTAEYIHNGLFSMHVPIVMTIHVSAKEILTKKDYERWCNLMASPLVYSVPISEYQKQQYKGLLCIEDVVYHGIEAEKYPFKEKPDKGSYLFTLGRVTHDKGQDKAIEIAKKTGSKLIIAGCVQNKQADRGFFESLKNSIDLFVDVGKQPLQDDYYDMVIKPLLNCGKQIIYIGELSSDHKKQWYRHARATLFPIQWGEPFGLVLVESMACGTPVIALNRGAVPEIMLDGKTGFIVDSVDAMIEAVDHINSIDPHECRRHVQNHFSITRMASKYSGLYQQIIVSRQISDSYSRLSSGYFPKPLHHGPIAT